MSRSIIYIASLVVGVVLLPSFVDQAHAGCNPPSDVSSCSVVMKENLAQPNPALPAAPFVVADPQTGKTLVMTDFNGGAPGPEHNNCTPSNLHGCRSVSSVDLMHSEVPNQTQPFLVRFEDGRSLLASPVN